MQRWKEPTTFTDAINSCSRRFYAGYSHFRHKNVLRVIALPQFGPHVRLASAGRETSHRKPSMLEFLFEIFGEFIFQVLLQALTEAGLHAWANPLRNPANPYLAALGYGVFGAMAGGLTLLIFPHNLVPAPWRLANVVLTPWQRAGWCQPWAHGANGLDKAACVSTGSPMATCLRWGWAWCGSTLRAE